MEQSKEFTVIPLQHSIIPRGSIFIAMCHVPQGREPIRSTITVNEPIGFGTFGLVYVARMNDREHPVALKQVLNESCNVKREVDIMCHIKGHCNVVRLLMYYYADLGIPRQRHVLMAMEYMPTTLFNYMYQHGRVRLPLINIRILSYQLFRGLGYLHSNGICHRDVKPDNMLLDPKSMNLKLADFGSATFIANADQNVCVGARLYRAPELYAKCGHYSTTVDIWSAGCVLAEMLKGSPLFTNHINDADQLVHIVCLLGTAGLHHATHIMKAGGITAAEIGMRTNWEILCGYWLPADWQDLLNSCLVYAPDARISGLQACAHTAFEALRTMDTLKSLMPNGLPLPPLFNFSPHELNVDPQLWMHLLPVHLQDRFGPQS